MAGCANIGQVEEYPSSWPARLESMPPGCGAVVGMYTAPLAERMELNYLAGAVNPGHAEQADRVEVILPKAGTLRIVAYRGETVVARRDFSESDGSLDCGKDQVRLTYKDGWVAGGGVVGYEYRSKGLSMDQDGSLIVSNDSSGAGLYVIFVYGKTRTWSRLKPLQNVEVPLRDGTEKDQPVETQ